MNKPIFIFFCMAVFTLISITGGNAQSTPKAQQYFEKKLYALALPEFEKELKRKKISRSDQVRIEGYIGMSNYYLNKPKEAASWLQKSITHGNNTASVHCFYGLSLQKQEKYAEAMASFNECLRIDPEHDNVKHYIASCEYALVHPDPNDQIRLRSSKINTDGSEYGISSVADGIFFSRASSMANNADPHTGLGYTEVFSATFTGDDLTNPKKETSFTKAYHNTGFFAYDTLTHYIYLTICNPTSKCCGIYHSKFSRKKWEKPEPLFVSEKYDMAHPALANGGSRLYFASNAPGGYGKTDIWYSDRISENQWSEPVNAGNKINSAGRDEFPFIEKDKILFFSSDGHPGFGGLDIFSITIDGDEPCELINPGRPFNSGADDFNLIISGAGGLLVSSRNPTKSDDIFIFNKTELPSPTLLKEKEPEPDIVVPVFNPEAEPAATIVFREEIVQDADAAPTPVTTSVQKEDLAVFYFDFNLFVPQPKYRNMYEMVAEMIRAKPAGTKFVIEGHTDERGNMRYNRELSEKRARYIYDRLVDRGVDPAYLRIESFGDSNPAVRNASVEEEYQLNRRVVIHIDFSGQ